MRRAEKKHIEFNLDAPWFKEKLSKGVCEATGLMFELEPKCTHINPYYPSIDRIDSSLGYTKDNCQLVIIGFNNLKGSNNSGDLKTFCEGFVRYKENKI